VYADMNSSVFRRDLNVPKVLADLVDSDREFQTVGAATANERSAKEVHNVDGIVPASS